MPYVGWSVFTVTSDCTGSDVPDFQADSQVHVNITPNSESDFYYDLIISFSIITHLAEDNTIVQTVKLLSKWTYAICI